MIICADKHFPNTSC